jgi:hypothetical protein
MPDFTFIVSASTKSCPDVARGVENPYGARILSYEKSAIKNKPSTFLVSQIKLGETSGSLGSVNGPPAPPTILFSRTALGSQPNIL